jgi:hypothetical protein
VPLRTPGGAPGTVSRPTRTPLASLPEPNHLWVLASGFGRHDSRIFRGLVSGVWLLVLAAPGSSEPQARTTPASLRRPIETRAAAAVAGPRPAA